MATHGCSVGRSAASRAALVAAFMFASTAVLAGPADELHRFDQDDARAEPGAAPAAGGMLAVRAIPDRDRGASGPSPIQGIHALQEPNDDARRGAGGPLRFSGRWKAGAPIIGPRADAVMSVDLGSQTALALRPRGGRWGLLLTRRW